MKNAVTVLPQNMQNVSFLCITETLSAVEQNAIFMQDENEFGTEELKNFKPEKAFIYTEKSTYELKN